MGCGGGCKLPYLRGCARAAGLEWPPKLTVSFGVVGCVCVVRSLLEVVRLSSNLDLGGSGGRT